MASPLSGSHDEINLVQIEAPKFSLAIKGKPYHKQYEGLRSYRKYNSEDYMEIAIDSNNQVDSMQVYDVDNDTYVYNDFEMLKPIFFENGNYQIVIIPKNEEKLIFYHEHPKLRNAVTEEKLGNQILLMGTLAFQNDIGFTTLEIQDSDRNVLLSLTIEIFPVKLSYREDYLKLLDEVNDEIYNLAFHFIRKTFLGAALRLEGNPTPTEFYRLITARFEEYIQAVTRIEKSPHHLLKTTHNKVRGDQLKRIDTYGRNYLRKNGRLFTRVENGININGKQVMPISGYTVKKELVYDTFENQYVKWTMERLIDKLKDLEERIDRYEKNRFEKDVEPDEELHLQIRNMVRKIQSKLKQPMWNNISKLNHSVLSIVLQMAPGYREVLQIYLIVSKGLELRNLLYKMSVKDVATLYEYWTFLKIGQILSNKYKQIGQDIIKVDRKGLFVNLRESQTASRKFINLATDEEITLTYQKRERNLPTVAQKPDTLLSIEKQGKDYCYNYVFDAKYRVDFAMEDSYYKNLYHSAGPLEEDINTMHRYRDSIVAESGAYYERTAFGAYVLFPWFESDDYLQHHFYKSIDKVNIGGLPFLPGAVNLVEAFIQRLIDKSADELQEEGILPIGTDRNKKSLQ